MVALRPLPRARIRPLFNFSILYSIMTRVLTLDGSSLALPDLDPILDGELLELRIGPSASEAVARARKLVDEHVERGDVVYGLTTGFGKLKSVAIAREDLGTLQRNLVVSHCCGVGQPMSVREVRVAQVLRINGLVRGHSGVRVETVEKLVRFFNLGFVPYVPEQGTVSASGDLAPLSHMAAAYMGIGQARLASAPEHEEWQDAADLLKAIGEEPLELHAKEGLALINGTETSKAIACGVLKRALNLSLAADAIASLTIEALRGSPKPFDARLAELKGHRGHARTSANIRACLSGSEIVVSHADCDRVQDPYSLRCVPQIHGATKAALAHVYEILSSEINGVTDNPVLFPDTLEVISAGQFHGQPVSMVMDYLGLAICTLANVSERRVEQLVNPDLSGLPAFLTPKPGLNSGFMIAQVSAAALASENKIWAHPASVDSVPTSANQEDHVSMAQIAARKARSICGNTEQVLAIEYLCAAQGLDFGASLRAGSGAQAIFDLLRREVAKLEEDRFMQPDIQAAAALLTSGALASAAQASAGKLEAC